MPGRTACSAECIQEVSAMFNRILSSERVPGFYDIAREERPVRIKDNRLKYANFERDFSGERWYS